MVLKNKFKYKNIIDFIKIVAFILFCISIYLIIRWSDIPVINSRLFNNKVFVNENEIDTILLSVVTGYFSGYLVYILTVVIPTMVRSNFFAKHIGLKLIAVCNDFFYIMLLMAKNAAVTEEWNNILNNYIDEECFNQQYYNTIKKFDITAVADTMLMKENDENKRKEFAWYEYLEIKIKHWEKEIEDTILRYQVYMDEDIIQVLYDVLQSRLFEMFLGKNISTGMKFQADNGYWYCENIPIAMFYDSSKEPKTPIFGKNANSDGSENLKECIESIFRLRKFLEKYIDDERIRKDFSSKKFKDDNKLGRMGTARCEEGVKINLKII